MVYEITDTGILQKELKNFFKNKNIKWFYFHKGQKIERFRDDINYEYIKGVADNNKSLILDVSGRFLNDK